MKYLEYGRLDVSFGGFLSNYLTNINFRIMNYRVVMTNLIECRPDGHLYKTNNRKTGAALFLKALPIPNGVKKFDVNGVKVMAINLKNALRKAAKN